MYLTPKRQTTFLMIKCIKSLKLKRSALLSDKIINKMASSCFSGNNLNVTFPKVEGCAYWNVNIKDFFFCTYLMLTNYMLLMADIMEPVRNVSLWL